MSIRAGLPPGARLHVEVLSIDGKPELRVTVDAETLTYPLELGMLALVAKTSTAALAAKVGSEFAAIGCCFSGESSERRPG